jgi:ubiquinone/menaquinone biosynthesis C-methylase UbiE
MKPNDDMKLNLPEFIAMNNIFRRLSQKYIEFRIFKNMLKKRKVDLKGKSIIDAGCGSGYSTELILNEFHPTQLFAFDYMAEQIYLAKKRKIKVDFKVGNMTKIESEDAQYDAIFVFGVIHHIPEWKRALSEALRVLNNRGVLLIFEPKAEFRFTWHNLESCFKQIGFNILEIKTFLFSFFHFYLCQKTIKA